MELKIIGNKHPFNNGDSERSVRLQGVITADDVHAALKLVGFDTAQQVHVTPVSKPYDLTAEAAAYERGKAEALPPGTTAYTEAELQAIIDNAFMRGKDMASAKMPANFPIPLDVWNGSRYGDFVTVDGFPPESIPAASENGYEIVRMYKPKDARIDNPHGFAMYSPEEMTQDMLDSGNYVALLIVVLR